MKLNKLVSRAMFLLSLATTASSTLEDVQANSPVDVAAWVRCFAPLLAVRARRRDGRAARSTLRRSHGHDRQA